MPCHLPRTIASISLSSSKHHSNIQPIIPFHLSLRHLQGHLQALPSAGTASFVPKGFSPLGGIPVRGYDLAASLVFMLAFAGLLPIAVLRLARLVAFVIRVIQSTGIRPSRLFFAEQFVLISGFLIMSLIFLLAFTIALPVALLSLFRLKSGPMAALCPFLFVMARLATFIIRAVQATGHDSSGLFIAEQAGAQVEGQLDWTVHTIKACRNANAGICLAVVVIVQVAIVSAFFAAKDLPARQTAYLFAISWLLTITSVYKSALYSLPAVDEPTTKITFYVVAALPELLVVTLYLLLNVKEEFGIEEEPSRNNGGESFLQ
ncbi:hypothetical protein RQP46_010781 [Phenoliferia psychrophenolica]